MKLIAYPVSRGSQKLVPASRTRAWMDKTPGSSAYHCLPMVMANSLGWFILNDTPCEVVWDGTAGQDGVVIHQIEEGSYLPISHFGSGIVTFHVDYLFTTEDGVGLMVGPPLNNPKHGASALSGVVETHWLPFTFTLNWKITAPGVRVRFERDEPLAQIFPWPMKIIGDTDPEISDLSSNSELKERFDDYASKREKFNYADGKDGGKRQKFYVRGTDSTGAKALSHETIWNAKNFKQL